MQVDLVQSGIYVARLITDRFHPHIGGNLTRDAGERLFDAFNHLDAVGARLPLNLERDGRNTVEARERALLLRAVFCPSDVAHSDRGSTDIGDDKIVKRLWI